MRARSLLMLMAMATLAACSPFEKPPGLNTLDSSSSLWTDKPTGLNAFDSKSFWCSGSACNPPPADAGSDRSGDASDGTAH